MGILSILLQIPTVPATNESTVDFTWLFIKMILLLGVVSIFAVLLIKYAVPHIGIMKRFQRGKYFKILGKHPLEPGKSLCLVQTGKRYLVIGISDNGINLITELTEGEAREAE
jgi:flagellar biosynthetic protein FliO